MFKPNYNPYSYCLFDHTPKNAELRAEYLKLYFHYQEEIGLFDVGNGSDDLIQDIAQHMAQVRIADANVRQGVDNHDA